MDMFVLSFVLTVNTMMLSHDVQIGRILSLFCNRPKEKAPEGGWSMGLLVSDDIAFIRHLCFDIKHL